ncbi:SCO family protein [uncultured Oceanicoccus sp.]|uniref:SCO family protein n=1 Tax=uncultured Oceanicoccus sp. TaxID=1706381 RepID=UPI0030D7DA55
MSEQGFNSQQDIDQNRKNRRVILGIFGIPALVLIVSTGLYFLVSSKAVDLGTVNNGELVVPPLQFTELPLVKLDGEAFDYTQPEPKWAFVVFGDQYCQDNCERMLYLARQSIVALAKKMHRVRLIYVTNNGIDNVLQQRFKTEYMGIDVISLNDNDVKQLFSPVKIDPFKANTFYVVDPRGWLMMHYEAENTEQDTLNTLGKAVVRDMKRLIK